MKFLLNIVFPAAICLPPDKVYNGGFHVYQPDGGPKYDIGSELQFYCEDGYKISGINNNIKCILSTDGSAKWSRAFPVCKGIEHHVCLFVCLYDCL